MLGFRLRFRQTVSCAVLYLNSFVPLAIAIATTARGNCCYFRNGYCCLASRRACGTWIVFMSSCSGWFGIRSIQRGCPAYAIAEWSVGSWSLWVWKWEWSSPAEFRFHEKEAATPFSSAFLRIRTVLEDDCRSFSSSIRFSSGEFQCSSSAPSGSRSCSALESIGTFPALPSWFRYYSG